VGAGRRATPKEEAVSTIRTILHPTDFSEAAEAAFQLACSVARDHRARVVLLHVYRPPVCHGRAVARRQPDSYEEDLRRMLRRLRAREPAVQVEHRLTEGDVVGEILRLAGELGCDLIVLGTHGRTGLARLLLGSVAEQVLRQAPCPVLVAKAPPPPAGPAPEPVSAGSAWALGS
jgi:nucleotide-binding universal stress UspA family protein